MLLLSYQNSMSFLERESVLKEGAPQEFSPRESLTLAPCWNTIKKKKKEQKNIKPYKISTMVGVNTLP